MVESEKPDFGARIKRLRQERGMTLRRISDATRISISALEALERNDISRWPGGIYSRSFVRSYAIEIGLDPEQAVREFLVQFPHDSATAINSGAPFENDTSATRMGVWTVTLVALGAILLLIGAALFLTL